jgi:hypothetical protein
MAPNVYDQYTRLLRTSCLELWVRLRYQLKSRGVDPSAAVLVNLCPDGADHEYGRVIADEACVYSFDLHFDRDSRRSTRSAMIRNWKDITGNWQNLPFSDETRDAFIWRLGEPNTHRAHTGPGRHGSGSRPSRG